MIVFLIRRDFRLDDNISLIEAAKECKRIDAPLLMLFVYNKDQISKNQNPYYSDNAMQFLVESLNDLQDQLNDIDRKARICRVLIKKTDDEPKLIKELHKQNPIISLFTNKDLTPFARHREDKLQDICHKLKINFFAYEDYTLFPMHEKQTKTNNGDAYKVFSFLYNKRKSLHKLIPEVQTFKQQATNLKWVDGENIRANRSVFETVRQNDDERFYEKNADVAVHGGRKKALEVLNKRIGRGHFKDYEKTRDEVEDEEGTTRLSAYLKNGCISIREFYEAVYEKHGIDHALIREIYFREFYYGIAWFYPRVLEGMLNPKSKKNKAFIDDAKVKWRNDKKGFELWKQGKTGTPFVDAGMRQMNKTGFMHNRLRMVVSMFLTKDLLIDWRDGEKYFATKLVDYHPIQNNAGWQWSASIGTDAAPYFRIMNPYTQGTRFDKDTKYIKKWIPELKDVKAADIHKWEDKKIREKYKDVTDYPAPYIEDHTAKAKETVALFKKAL